jgi:branched-chain amino acid aminotransferase
MIKLYDNAYFNNKIIPITEANLNIASSAVLYGLSVYTVFPINITSAGPVVFRPKDHFKRLLNSAQIIGIDTFAKDWNYEKFLEAVKNLVKANDIKENVFVRATVHVDELIPGTRSRGLKTNLSIFIYEAVPIVPQDGMKLKTSVWRRIPDYAIPSRAKVNGAYINSVLAKQDAIDSGYDDCIFLDSNGHVCELSAANIFLVKDHTIITPDTASDLLEGINRQTILEIIGDLKIPYKVRTVDMTELYTADEVFVCGTSSFIAPVTNIDARVIGDGTLGTVTKRLRDIYKAVQNNEDVLSTKYITRLS